MYQRPYEPQSKGSELIRRAIDCCSVVEKIYALNRLNALRLVTSGRTGIK